MINITTTPDIHAAFSPVIIAGTAGTDIVKVECGGNTIYEPVVNGTFICDVAPLVRKDLFSVGYPTPTASNAVTVDDITVTEIDEDGDPADSETVTDVVFHRAVELRQVSTATPGLMLQETGNRIVAAGTKIPIGCISPENVKINNVNITPTDGRVQVFITPANNSSLTLGIYNQETPAVLISNEQKFSFDTKCYPNGLTIYWLNRYGGYEVYSFIDTESAEQSGDSVRFRTQVNGVLIDRKLPTESYEMVTLVGRLETRETAYYLRDLASSAEVFAADGTPLIVDSDTINIYSEGEFRPTVTVIKKLTRCINY